MRALLLEQDLLERDMLDDTLRARGHAVQSCANAREAEASDTASVFGLIVISGEIARGHAPRLCRTLRAQSSGETPVILVLGWNGDACTLIDAGADDCVPVDFSDDLLGARLMLAERRHQERARHAVEARTRANAEAGIRAFIEGAPDGIVMCRSERIVHVNEAALAILGYESAVGLIGRSYVSLVHPEDSPAEQTRLSNALSSGVASLRQEIKLSRSDAALAEVESVIIPLSFGGDAAFAVMLCDLSQQKQVERRLLVAEHMAALGTLSAGIAHELNNPLSYVLANLHFIEEDVVAARALLPEQKFNSLKELTAQAIEGGNRVQTIVRDLKKFSRVDGDDDETIELVRVIDTAINMASNEIRHRAQLERCYAAVPPVAGNEARLGQVFLNLLVNAAQAMPVGHVSANKITVNVQQLGERVVVEVQDTGTGMPEAVLSRIFDPFFTTKPVGVGTGLGLSICREIIAGIGGEIAVESTLGRGSTFRVSLPLARPSGVRARVLPSLPAPASPRALRILVVDDEPNVVRALERALRGNEVMTATSGDAALHALESEGEFDLVFCDLMMSSLSGMELYDWVKAHRPGTESAFVFMTGGVFTQQANDFLAALPNPVVHKPFDLKALRKLVGQRFAA